MTKNITEYNYRNGHKFNGFRVLIQKNGIHFCTYISSKGITREEALKLAIKTRDNLIEKINGCITKDDVINLHNNYDRTRTH